MNVPLADSYRPAMFMAAGAQFVCGVLSGMLLDGGNAVALCFCTFVGFWVGACIVMLRHPRNPSYADVWVIRYGFPPLFLFGLVIMETLLLWYE